jgi:hypothetical protein
VTYQNPGDPYIPACLRICGIITGVLLMEFLSCAWFPESATDNVRAACSRLRLGRGAGACVSAPQQQQRVPCTQQTHPHVGIHAAANASHAAELTTVGLATQHS